MTSLTESGSVLFSPENYDTSLLLDCYPTQDLPVNQAEIIQLAQKYLSTPSPPSNSSNNSSPPNSFLDTTNILNQNLPTDPIVGFNAMNYMQQIFGTASGSGSTMSNQLLNFPMLHPSKCLIDPVQDPSRLINQHSWLSYCNKVKQEQQTSQYGLESKRSKLEIWSNQVAAADEQYRLSTTNNINSANEVLGTSSINIPGIPEQYESNPQVLIPSGSKRRKTSTESFNSSSPCSNSPLDNPLQSDERKRIVHILAEKNRRTALKDGFDKLVDAIPAVDEAGIRATSAVVLNRAGQHIRNLKAHSEGKEKQIEEMKDKIAQMKEKIAMIQSNLSPNGRCDNTSNNSADQMRNQVQMFFERYRREQSKQDSRFLLMSEVLEPLVQSYADDIHPNASEQEKLLLSACNWTSKSWNLATLRPLASATILKFATQSTAFTDSSEPLFQNTQRLNISL